MLPRTRLAVAVALLAVAIRPARGDERPAPDLSGCESASAAELEGHERRVGRIEVIAGDIFDESKPEERFALFRAANRLHRTTRPEVIRRMLLFASGDRYSARLVAESERILRSHRYFFDARIVPIRCEGDRVDLEVRTRDVWSLDAGARFGRSGGTNSVSFDAQDKNFLGTGKELAAVWETNVDRDTALLRYQDDRLLGTHLRLETEVAKSTDGHAVLVDFARPFYSLDTRWSAGLHVVSDDLVDSRYRLGHVFDRFRHASELVELSAGWSPGRQGDSTMRLSAGLRYEDQSFTAVGPDDGSGPPTGELPRDRTLAYPWVAWEWAEDGYVVASDLDKIRRSEDLNLGREAAVRLGRNLGGLGASESSWIVSARWSDGVRLGERHLLVYESGFSGRFGDGGARDVRASFSARDLMTDFGRHRLVLGVWLDATRRADPETQLLLGGDNGLRGYPLRYQEGDRRVLFSIEQRFYSEREILHVAHLGAAIFADAGRAWFNELHETPARSPGPGPASGWLGDVGVGLRLSSSRSSRGAMIHFDLALPLAGPSDLAHLQWLVTTSDRF
ncbi:MAG: hypothetical protein IPJ17_18260 [Holophagales bacterium]|nr:MAG: hypothetical protein IPJ17_18260 [Holophagales bacterium]